LDSFRKSDFCDIRNTSIQVGVPYTIAPEVGDTAVLGAVVNNRNEWGGPWLLERHSAVELFKPQQK
jgi:hypothetical protein